MGTTLEDVGRRCGVSRSTVSRVINNSPLVNEATKQRVLKAIRELKYAPHFIARSLTKNRTETLAVTLPDITGGVFPELLAGMDEVASRRGYHLLVVFIGGARPKTTTVEELVSHRRVDAIVTIASTVEDKDLVKMAEWEMPIVCLAHKSPLPQVPSVLYDDAGGAMEATRLLLGQGRRRLVHLRGPRGNFDADERSRGFREALKEAGIPFESKREAAGDFLREGGARAMRAVLDGKVEVDGVFAANDEMAIGAIEVLGERGVSVPGDVAVVGFDDIEAARFVGLSTVRAPSREAGRVAAQMAFDMIDGNKPDSRTLPAEIIQRASTRAGGTVDPLKIGSSPKR